MELELNTENIRKISKKIEKSIVEVQQIIALKAWSSLVFKTPVGNPDLWQSPAPSGYSGGQAKHSWFIQYSKPSEKLPKTWSESTPPTPKIRQSKEYDVIFITSKLPYMKALEEGHSTQGQQMIQRTMSEINLELKTALR